MMPLRFISLLASAVILGGGLVVVGLGGCSLGETVAQDCDPNAAPDSPNACYEVSACDDGKGGLDTGQDGCCAACAILTYEKCVGTQIDVLEEFCGINKPGDTACCSAATSELAACETGAKVDCDPSTQHSPVMATSATTGSGAGGSGAGGADSGSGGA